MRTKDGSEADESPDHVVGLFVAEARRRLRPNVQLVSRRQRQCDTRGQTDTAHDLAGPVQPTIDQPKSE